MAHSKKNIVPTNLSDVIFDIIDSAGEGGVNFIGIREAMLARYDIGDRNSYNLTISRALAALVKDALVKKVDQPDAKPIFLRADIPDDAFIALADHIITDGGRLHTKTKSYSFVGFWGEAHGFDVLATSEDEAKTILRDWLNSPEGKDHNNVPLHDPFEEGEVTSLTNKDAAKHDAWKHQSVTVLPIPKGKHAAWGPWEQNVDGYTAFLLEDGPWSPRGKKEDEEEDSKVAREDLTEEQQKTLISIHVLYCGGAGRKTDEIESPMEQAEARRLNKELRKAFKAFGRRVTWEEADRIYKEHTGEQEEQDEVGEKKPDTGLWDEAADGQISDLASDEGMEEEEKDSEEQEEEDAKPELPTKLKFLKAMCRDRGIDYKALKLETVEDFHMILTAETESTEMLDAISSKAGIPEDVENAWSLDHIRTLLKTGGKAELMNAGEALCMGNDLKATGIKQRIKALLDTENLVTVLPTVIEGLRHARLYGPAVSVELALEVLLENSVEEDPFDEEGEEEEETKPEPKSNDKKKPTKESSGGAINTTPEKARKFWELASKTIEGLAERWVDESKYEDIEDYAKPLQNYAKKAGVTITSMVKRPFGVKFTVDGHPFQIKCTAKEVVMIGPKEAAIETPPKANKQPKQSKDDKRTLGYRLISEDGERFAVISGTKDGNPVYPDLTPKALWKLNFAFDPDYRAPKQDKWGKKGCWYCFSEDWSTTSKALKGMGFELVKLTK